MSGPPQVPSTPSGRSVSTTTTNLAELDFGSELGTDATAAGSSTAPGTRAGEDAVHFVLLAEFDIDAGATLAHQYPYPTGTDE